MSVIIVHFKKPQLPNDLLIDGWPVQTFDKGILPQVYLGEELDGALHHIVVARACGAKFDAIRLISGKDIIVRYSGNKRCKDGSYRWNGFEIRLFPSSHYRKKIHFYGPIEEFEELARMFLSPDFTTDWFECRDRKLVEKWEAEQRPTLAERLASIREIAGRKANGPGIRNGRLVGPDRKIINGRLIG